MLIIRLSRVGRRNLPMFRVVLTEHSKSVKAGYSEVLGSFNPLKGDLVVNTERVEQLLTKGVQLSERVARLMLAHTKNEMYKNYFSLKNSSKTTKNPEKYS